MALTDICRTQLSDAGNDFPFHDKATEDYDCNVAMCSEAVELVTGVQLTAAETRKLGGAVGPKPTGLVLARRVFKSQGLVYGTDYVVFRKAPTSDVRDMLKDHWFVVGHLMYGKLGELEPDLICDDYQDAHAVGLFDFWRGQGEKRLHMADPLADGRRSGGLGRKVAKGVQTWPWNSVREALWAFTEKYEGADGPGFVSGYAVMPR